MECIATTVSYIMCMEESEKKWTVTSLEIIWVFVRLLKRIWTGATYFFVGAIREKLFQKAKVKENSFARINIVFLVVVGWAHGVLRRMRCEELCLASTDFIVLFSFLLIWLAHSNGVRISRPSKLLKLVCFLIHVKRKKNTFKLKNRLTSHRSNWNEQSALV